MQIRNLTRRGEVDPSKDHDKEINKMKINETKRERETVLYQYYILSLLIEMKPKYGGQMFIIVLITIVNALSIITIS